MKIEVTAEDILAARQWYASDAYVGSLISANCPVARACQRQLHPDARVTALALEWDGHRFEFEKPVFAVIEHWDIMREMAPFSFEVPDA